MRIDRILTERRPVFSFEFFPPKTDEGHANLRKTLEVLSQDQPDFVSVTYGALGSTRDTTIDIVKWIKQDLGIEAMAHFTCVGATKEQLRATHDESEAAGLENVLALRGDPPAVQDEFYFDFVARAREAGVTVPIVPGIMPVTNLRNIRRITELCKSEIPEAFERQLGAREDDPQALQDLGVAYATLQCLDLLSRGAPGIHFYTLNRSPATRAILAALRAAQPWTRAKQPV